MFQVALDSRIFDRFISPKRSVLPNSFNISSLSVITQKICQYLNNNALGHLYVSLSVEKLVSWEMMGFKDSGRVQSSIENTRRKHSAKRASNICLFHSVGIRIRKTIIKQVVQRYLPIYGAILFMRLITSMMCMGITLNICKIAPSMSNTFVISEPPSV